MTKVKMTQENGESWFALPWVRYSLLGLLSLLILGGFLLKASLNYSVWYGTWYKWARFIHHGALLAAAIVVVLLCFRRSDKKKPEKVRGKGPLRLFSLHPLGENGRRWLNIILALLILCGVFGFYNYGRFHGNVYTHWWELIHYQFGSKYFPELGYDNLYFAFLAADRETGHRLRHVKTVRDLSSNEIITVAKAEPKILAIRSKFTPERWEQFKKEFVFYRPKDGRWSNIVVDHGYNPSPVWTVTGRAVTGLLDALGFSTAQAAGVMAHLDPLLLLIMFLLVWRAFGIEVTAMLVVFWGANPMVMFDFTGGAFLRQDWLAALVSGIALLRMRRLIPAAALITYSASTRIFPGVFFLFPCWCFVRDWWKTRRLPKELTRFLLSAAVAGVLLFGLSLKFAGGLDSWKTFLANASEHDKGVYTNHVSLRNLFIYEYNNNARSFARYGGHYHEKWRIHKEKRMARLKPVYYGSILVFTALFFWYYRKEDFESGLWMCGFLPFLFFYPANYYFMFLLPVLLVALRSPAAASGFLGAMLLGFIGKRFVRGYDVYHIWLSLLLLVSFLAFLFYKKELDGAEGVETGKE